MNILVTNLSRRIGYDDLEWLFRGCGMVNYVSLWVDTKDKSRRFAIVQMRHPGAARSAIKKLNGRRLGRRVLWVEEAPESFGVLLTLCAEASRGQRNACRPLSSEIPQLCSVDFG